MKSGSKPLPGDTGSPNSGEPVFFVAGRIGRPHGVRGEVSFYVSAGFPERLQAGRAVFVGEEKICRQLAGVRGAGKKLIFAFAGISDRDQAATLRNQLVFVPEAEAPPLPDGALFPHQLMGLRVVAEDGRDLGKVVDIIVTGANDVYVVRDPAGAERLLPAIDEVVLHIDLGAKTIRVHLMAGL